MPTSSCQNLFGENLKQCSLRNRTDREHALGMFETQSRPLPAGDGDHRHCAGRQSLLTDGSSRSPRPLIRV